MATWVLEASGYLVWYEPPVVIRKSGISYQEGAVSPKGYAIGHPSKAVPNVMEVRDSDIPVETLEKATAIFEERVRQRHFCRVKGRV